MLIAHYHVPLFPNWIVIIRLACLKSVGSHEILSFIFGKGAGAISTKTILRLSRSIEARFYCARSYISKCKTAQHSSQLPFCRIEMTRDSQNQQGPTHANTLSNRLQACAYFLIHVPHFIKHHFFASSQINDPLSGNTS